MANPNPSPETRFKPGQSGNPGGKTEGQRAAEIEAAAIAANLRLKALSSLQEIVDGMVSEDGKPDIAAIHKALAQSENLKLFKDSEDRAHGTPKTAMDLTNSDGSLTKLTDEQLQARLAALRESVDPT